LYCYRLPCAVMLTSFVHLRPKHQYHDLLLDCCLLACCGIVTRERDGNVGGAQPTQGVEAGGGQMSLQESVYAVKISPRASRHGDSWR
jgi:hypothetical protein